MATSSHLAVDANNQPLYSPEQLQAYFDRIKLPQKYLDSVIFKDRSLAQTKEHGLPFLDALLRYHLCNVPFENLELHYSAHKTITLRMDDLYNKFVERGKNSGRGGRCMENNGFLGTVLRSLGFDVRNCAGRVSRHMMPNTPQDQLHTYAGWNHMLNLVRFDDQWYVTDGGMGAMGPNIVYPLQDGYEAVSIAPRKIRLQLRSIPEHAAAKQKDAQKLWCFDVCHKPTDDPAKDTWIPTYTFTETEFLPQDYEMMSWYTSTHPSSFFTWMMLCTRMLMDEQGERIVGDLSMVDDKIRKTVGGKREVSAELKTEQERLDALKDMFGLEFTEEERQGVRSQLKLGEQTNENL